MILINKERLLEDLRERSSLDWDDEGEDYGLLVSRIIVDEQPTVEAIPVEWLKERYKIEGYYGTDEYFRKAYAVKEIIADWEAEQRKEE